MSNKSLVLQKFKLYLNRFGFPTLLLLLTLVFRTEWISSWEFLGRFVNWRELGGFLRNNSEGFFIAALIAFYLEITRPNTFSSYFRAQLAILDSFLASAGSNAGVRFFLKNTYDSQGANSLAEYVISDKPIIRNCDVRIALYSSPQNPEPNAYQIIDIRYECQVNEVLLLCARNTSIQALLMTVFPEILETVVLDAGGSFVESCEKLAASNPVRIDGKPVPIARKNFSRDQRSEFLEGLSILEDRDYLFYASRPVADAVGGPRNVAVTLRIPMDRGDAGTAYWMADRPMHVRRIAVDAKGLDNFSNLEFKVIRFLWGGDYSGAKSDIVSSLELDISVNRWLVHGQGVAVLWHSRTELPSGGKQHQSA
jgi:hypothetical protein